MQSRGFVLPDGPAASGAATSWRVYRFGLFDFLSPAVGRDSTLTTAEDLG